MLAVLQPKPRGPDDRSLFVIGTPALNACASSPPSPIVATRPVTLNRAFVGQKRGAGVFRVWLTGDERRFTALLNGQLSQDARRLTVVEDFVHDDDQQNRLTRVFERTFSARWTGQREDPVGAATVIEKAGEVRLTCTADFESDTSVTRPGFSDVIHLPEGGVTVSDAIVSRGRFPVGSVRFETGAEP